MDAGAEGGEYAYLSPGVFPLDVRGGVLLGVALLLRLGQSLLKGNAVRYHLGEYIIRRSVQNTVYLLYTVRGEALAQGAQNGYSPAHAGLKEIIDAFLLRYAQKLMTVGGHQLFVGGYQALSGHKHTAGELIGYAHAADGLHDYGDLRVVLHQREVLYHILLKGAAGKLPDVHDILYADLTSAGASYAVGVHSENLRNTGAYGSETKNSNLYHERSSFRTFPNERLIII